MALNKREEIGSIEVQPSGCILVRKDIIIEEDGVELSKTFHRHVVEPDSDISGEDQRVKDVANVVHTSEIKAQWVAKKLAEQEI